MVEKADDELDKIENDHFDLLMNASGDVMLVFQSVAGKPENPLFFYDGHSQGFLCKNKQYPSIPFTPLPKEAQDALNKLKTVLCVEVSDEHIIQQYMAKIEVKK